MKWVFKHQEVQMFGLKLNKYQYFSQVSRVSETQLQTSIEHVESTNTSERGGGGCGTSEAS